MSQISKNNRPKWIIGAVILIAAIILLIFIPFPGEQSKPTLTETEIVDTNPISEEQRQTYLTLKQKANMELDAMQSHLSEAKHSSLQLMVGTAQTLFEDGQLFWKDEKAQTAIERMQSCIDKTTLFAESLILQEDLIIEETKNYKVLQEAQDYKAYQWSREHFLNGAQTAEKAASLVEAGDFSKAIDSYANSTKAYNDAIQDVRNQISDVQNQTLQAYKERKQSEAIELAEKWVEYRPQNPQANTWLKRAQVLNEVTQLSHKGDQFVLQNEYVFAKKAFEQALDLDQAFTSAKEGIQIALQKIEEASVDTALRKCNKAIEQKDYVSAWDQILTASSLHPNETRIRELQQLIRQNYLPQIIQKKVKEGIEAMNSLDYKSAIKLAENALMWDKASANAVELKAKAELRLQNAMTAEKYIEAGLEKLESNQIQDQLDSKLYFEKAVELDPYSKNNQSHLNKCIVLIDTLMKPISVTLRSDGLSKIQIFKIGTFEPFETKTIELTPGTYQIKVKRKGHQDGFYQISIQQGTKVDLPLLTTEGKI